MQADSFIPCGGSINQVSELVWKGWKERLLVERLLEKSTFILDCCRNNNFHWEETFWWLLARNFGVKVNSDTFENIARSIPLSVLARHKHQVLQIECLLMGQAGMLTGKFKDKYMQMLQQEYNFLGKKYKLKPIHLPLHFLRMRPSNFPTIRLAQLAMLIHQSQALFSKILQSESLENIGKLLNVTANDYWHYHYLPDEESPYKEKHLGRQMTENILINTVLPVLFTYGAYKKDMVIQERAVQWFGQIKAESNRVCNGFQSLGITVKTAVDSQALLHLQRHYCNHKRCLDCAVGGAIIRQQATTAVSQSQSLSDKKY